MIELSAKTYEIPKLLTREAERIWHQGIEDALDVMADIVLGKAKKYAPVDSGRLRNGLFVELPEGRRGGVRFVTSPSPYAYVMEHGRKPGGKWPPEAPISLWVRRQLGIPPEDPRHASAVYFLRRKIAKQGIQPRAFFQLAADFGNEEARRVFDRAMRHVGRKLERRA